MAVENKYGKEPQCEAYPEYKNNWIDQCNVL